MPAAVICSLLSWSRGASLEMFSKLKNSGRYIPKMHAPGIVYLYLRSGAEGRGLRHVVRCIRVHIQAAQDRLLQSFTVGLQALFSGNAALVSPACRSALRARLGLVLSHTGDEHDTCAEGGEEEDRNEKCLFLPL